MRNIRRVDTEQGGSAVEFKLTVIKRIDRRPFVLEYIQAETVASQPVNYGFDEATALLFQSIRCDMFFAVTDELDPGMLRPVWTPLQTHTLRCG